MITERVDEIDAQHVGILLFVGLAIVWGSGFVAIEIGLAYFPPTLYAALRNGSAAVVVLCYAAVVTDRIRPRGRREWCSVATSGLLIVGASQGLLFLGQRTTTSAIAAIITGLIPLLTVGFARLVPPQERVGRRRLAGLVVGLAGAILVAGPPSTLGGGGTVGRVLLLLGAGCFALGSVVTQRIDASLPTATHQAWALCIGGLSIHGASALLGESTTSIQLTGEAVGALVYLIVVPSALGFLLYFKLLDLFDSTEANLVMNVSPIFATVIGWALLSEGIGPLTFGGFLVIGAGWVLVGTS